MFVSERWWVLLYTYHMAGNGSSTVSMGGGVEWCV